MKQLLRWPGSILLATCLFFSLTAADASGRGKPPPKIVYTGIESVDTTAMTITVGPKNSTATGTKTYKFTAQTKITVNGKPGTVADLHPGLAIHFGLGASDTIAEELSATEPPADPKPGNR